MTGKEWGISDQQVVEILQREFAVEVDYNCPEELERARMALVLCKDREDFLEKAGWQQDNPELTEESYLTENRICRWVEGKFVFFSRLLWESDIKKSVG